MAPGHANGVRSMAHPRGLDALTPTEAKVVRLVCRGLSNPDIARELGISPRTVQSHLASIFRKLRVSTRTELAVFATRAAAPEGPDS